MMRFADDGMSRQSCMMEVVGRLDLVLARDDAMTEQEWLLSNDVGSMVRYLGLQPSGRSRKLRLFAVACCRRVWHLLPDEPSRQAVLVAERYADGLTRTAELKAAYAGAGGDALHRGYNPAGPVVRVNAPTGAYWTAQNAHTLAGQHNAAGKPLGRYERARADLKEKGQTDLLREIFGKPFCPVAFEAGWLTPVVLSLARAAYEDRESPSGELACDRLAVLSDALEEAGCDDSILDHLRGPGPHVRGCWCLTSSSASNEPSGGLPPRRSGSYSFPAFTAASTLLDQPPLEILRELAPVAQPHEHQVQARHHVSVVVVRPRPSAPGPSAPSLMPRLHPPLRP